MAAVSKREVCTVSMSSRDVRTGSRSNHDVSRRELSRRDHSASTTDVCRREVPRRDGCGHSMPLSGPPRRGGAIELAVLAGSASASRCGQKRAQ